MESRPHEARTHRSISLTLSRAEWREFLDYVSRYHAGVDQFFTQKALELIADGRQRAGKRPN